MNKLKQCKLLIEDCLVVGGSLERVIRLLDIITSSKIRQVITHTIIQYLFEYEYLEVLGAAS